MQFTDRAGSFVLGVLLALLLSVGVSGYLPENGPQRADLRPADRQLARDATWTMLCKGKPCGTAVQVKPGLFLTAAHITLAKFGASDPAPKQRIPSPDELAEQAPVKQDIPLFQIQKNDRQTEVLEVLFDDDTTDVAVFRADTTCPCVPVANRAPRLGSEVFTVGYPLLRWRERLNTQEATVTRGLLQERVTPLEDSPPQAAKEWYFTSVHVSQGNSGGGLFTRVGGQLAVVGIASAFPNISMGGGLFGRSNALNRLGFFATWESIQRGLREVFSVCRLQ